MDKQQLIDSIKSKKELREISDTLVSDSLDKYLIKHKIILSGLKKSDLRIIIKQIRAELRNYVGQFQISVRKKERFLEKDDFESLLKLHSSTKERLNFYPELKKLILSLNVKSILDLGCGINPIALADKNVTYYASDVNESDLKAVRKFFEENKINGEVFTSDLRKLPENLPDADLCILFKVLDTIEKKNHKIAESLIANLKYKYLLVSFSTKKLSGKAMNFPRRKWLEKMLSRLSLEYKVFSSENEIFYLISSSKQRSGSGSNQE